MASLRVHPDRLEIHLTPAEKTLAFRREGLVIQRDTIRSVTITDDPWIWVRGIRAPGALVPLVLAVGVWKFHGGKDFLAIKRRRQAVVIDLVGDDFARVILSTNHAPDLIASLKLEPADLDADVDAAVDAAEATTPTKPAKKARIVKPAKPVKPATPDKPARRVRTVKPVTPAEADAPVEPVEPVTPVAPVAPVEPTDSARPTAVESAEVPAAKPAKRVRAPKAKPAAPLDEPEATA